MPVVVDTGVYVSTNAHDLCLVSKPRLNVVRR